MMKKWRCTRGLTEKLGGLPGDILSASRSAAMEDFDCDMFNEGSDCFGCDGPLEVSSRGNKRHPDVAEAGGVSIPAPVCGGVDEGACACAMVPACTAMAAFEEDGESLGDGVIDASFTEGEQESLGGEDVFPSFEGTVGSAPSVVEAQNKLLFVREQMQAADKAIKDIKKDAVAPFQGEITENQRRKDMLTITFDYYVVESALEEARVKSLHEDPVFCAYIAAADKKFLKVKVGTRQDVREAAVMEGDANVYVFGEYQNGKDVNATEDSTQPVDEDVKEEGAA